MSGKAVFRNIMGILQPGVDSIITERNNQIYGPLLEKAVQLSLEIVILVFEKDLLLSDFWRPLYQVITSMLDVCFFSKGKKKAGSLLNILARWNKCQSSNS